MAEVSLGLCHLGFLEVPPPELIGIAAGAGFSGVSLRTRAAMSGGVAYDFSADPAMARATRARLEETGLGILQVELASLSRDTDLDALRRFLESGAALGAARVVATGDDEDETAMAEAFAAFADLAAGFGMSVDVEFMRFRPLGSLAQTIRVLTAAGRPNLKVMIDALHLFRSGGTCADIAAMDAGLIGCLQLCDAPAAPPRDGDFAGEARGGRLLPGDGDLPLGELVALMPPGTLLAAEVPLAPRYRASDPLARARAIFSSTRALLEAGSRAGGREPAPPAQP
jgi:sugar phosphate isomerase/epimerase